MTLLRRVSRPRRPLRAVACSAGLVLLSLLVASPLEAQGAEVSVRIGVAGGGAMCPASVVPGVELRTLGRLHAFGSIDAYLTRMGESNPCVTRLPGNMERYRRAETSPPRMLRGAGWCGEAGFFRPGARV